MGICSGTSTEWLFVHCSRSNWNLAVLVFVEEGKPENPEKNPRSEDENQQQTQPTYDAGSGNRTRATLVGGECSHARVIVEKHNLHYLLPSSKFTIFIIYYTLDDFDIADPSSLQDPCHIST